MDCIRFERAYDKDFKIGAVCLVLEGGRSAPLVVSNLQFSHSVIYNWVHRFTDDPGYAFPGYGILKPSDQQNNDLNKELERTTRTRNLIR